jgi:predicted kinase
MIDPHEVARAWCQLGQDLARWRHAARHTQHSFAPLTSYGRSTIANVETGHQHMARTFWVLCDRLLGAGGDLITAYETVEDLEQRYRRQRARAAPRDRHSTGDVTASRSVAAAAAPGDVAVRRIFEYAVPGGADVATGPNVEGVQRRLLDAHDVHRRRGADNPVLILIGGYAGSGKSELGRLLAGMTGWPLLDKDLITRPLVEHLLSALGNDPNDRHSDTYLQHVRPVEYRCLLNAAFAQLDAGTSSILTAPFLQEMPDPGWLRRLAARCASRDIDVVPVWVDTDAQSMYDYLVERDAARDTWKLNHWDTYLAGVDPALRPALPHIVIDNGGRAAVTLPGQAAQLATIVSPS